MFQKLVASAGKQSRTWSARALIISVSMHALLVSGAVWATAVRPVSEEAAEPEAVTFVELQEEPEPAAPEPPPPAPEPPAAAPPPPQGFQELLPPEMPPPTIPEVDLAQPPVRAEDFSGLGQRGGTAAGVEGGVPTAEVPRDSAPVFTLEETGSKPELLNVRDVVRALEREYPRSYVDAGLAGEVLLRFLIDTDGRVPASSVVIVEATNEAFGEAAKRVIINRARFRPVIYRGEPVRVWATMPVRFQVPG